MLWLLLEAEEEEEVEVVVRRVGGRIIGRRFVVIGFVGCV
jgi:hypothetical protein